MRLQRRLFTATGSGAFPMDMLRAEQCYPVGEYDSILISCETFRRPIVLATQHYGAPLPLQVERWASFGWTVKEI